MALMKTSPMAPSAKRDLEDLVGRIFRTPFGSFDLAPFTKAVDEFLPPLDLVESDKEFVPGSKSPGSPGRTST
jgi:hypothetical protein